MSRLVLDASAFLAYLVDEPGAAAVEQAMYQGTLMSAVNWAEVLSKLAERNQSPDIVQERLVKNGIIGSAVEIVPLVREDAAAIARLRPLTKKRGLSLGDRACLALGIRMNLPVLTADGSWKKLPLGMDIRTVR